MSAGSIVAGVLSPSLSGAAADVKSKNSPEKIKEAASQFEALLIGEVLKTAHEGDSEGWMGTGEDQTAGAALGLADQFLAQTMAKKAAAGTIRVGIGGWTYEPWRGGMFYPKGHAQARELHYASRAVTTIEYSLIVCLISTAAIGALTNVGQTMLAFLGNTANALH